MWFSLSIVLFGIACHCSVALSSTGSDGELVLLHILYRHGDRAPGKTFPTDPITKFAWPRGFGQLTETGMKQHYQLGRYFRDRYINGNPYRLLSPNYNDSEIRVISTDYDRTLMSAYCNLAGFFPPEGVQLWNPNIPWQPIPVHTEPQATDHLLNVKARCPKYDEEYKKVLNSAQVKEVDEKNKEFYEFIETNSGAVCRTVTDVWKIADPLLCELSNGFALPEWVNRMWQGQTTYEKLQELNAMDFSLKFDQPQLKRFRGGVLLGEIVKNILKNIESETNPKARQTNLKCRVYSAHDDTVTALTSAMNVFNGIAPPYATTVMVELIRRDSEYFIQLQYKNDSSRDPYILTVPGCVQLCPLNRFQQLVQDNIPLDWNAECHKTRVVAESPTCKSESKSESPSCVPEITMVASLFTAVSYCWSSGVLGVALLTIMFIWKFVKRRS